MKHLAGEVPLAVEQLFSFCNNITRAKGSINSIPGLLYVYTYCIYVYISYLHI